jgi:hypothetical protein
MVDKSSIFGMSGVSSMPGVLSMPSDTMAYETVISSFEALLFKDDPCEFMSDDYRKFEYLAQDWYEVISDSLYVNEFMIYYNEHEYFTCIYANALCHVEKLESFCKLQDAIERRCVTYSTLFNGIKEPEFNNLFEAMVDKLDNYNQIKRSLLKYQNGIT